jgi:hypothetical protein
MYIFFKMCNRKFKEWTFFYFTHYKFWNCVITIHLFIYKWTLIMSNIYVTSFLILLIKKHFYYQFNQILNITINKKIQL